MAKDTVGSDRTIAAYVRAVRRDPCSYCGAPAEISERTRGREGRGKLDHVVARARGGGDEWWNLTAVCGSCNSSKRTSSLIGFLLWRRFKIERERSAELQEMVQRLLVEPRLAREVGR